MSRRLEFKESPIKARSFLTPEQIQARSVARFGIKVQITDPTIAKIKKAILETWQRKTQDEVIHTN